MTGVATIVVLVLAVATMVVTGVRAARDLPAERPELATAAVLELAVLVYVVVRVVDLVGGHRPSSVGIVVAYLVGTLLVMPVTAALGYAERSKWGPIVLGVGALVVCVLLARVDQLWSAGG